MSLLDDKLKRLAADQRRIAGLMKPSIDAAQRLSTSFAPILKLSAEFQRRIDAHMKDFGPTSKRLAQLGRKAELLDQSGWLPHYTTPFHLIDECIGDPASLSEQLSNFYESSWLEVKAEILEQISNYSIDDEAKETLSEALSCHEAGSYRASVRLLFPEVERVARVELHDDKVGTIVTSQRELRKLASSFTPAELEPKGLYSYRLYKCLNDHLYSYLNDETERDQIKASDVPNRHASVHGYLIYKTAKNSLNTIFMTDFLFQVVSASKELEGD